MPKIRVVPVRATGWVIQGQSPARPPEPFTVALQSSELGHWTGIVLDRGHVFEGRQVIISQSHTCAGDEVKVAVAEGKGGQRIASGCAVFDPPLGTR
jgi:hypothetical protein